MTKNYGDRGSLTAAEPIRAGRSHYLSPALMVAFAAVAGCHSEPRTRAADDRNQPAGLPIRQESTAYRSALAELGGITLHYLDWGGSGEVLLFLAGGGQTAYEMAGLADRFKDSHRVLALTRRGTGESSHPDSGYTIDDHVSDIIGFLDELGVAWATLVGHSMAGAEMTRVAELYPSRVHRLVYLDATFDYAGYAQMVAANPHPRTTARDVGVSDLASLREYSRTHIYGFWSDSLEADLRASVQSSAHPDLTAAFIEDAMRRPNNYSAVFAPALAFVVVEGFADWAPADYSAATPEMRAEMEEYFRTVRQPWGRAGADRFSREIRNGKVIELAASHHFFIPHEDRVVREMTAFFAQTRG